MSNQGLARAMLALTLVLLVLAITNGLGYLIPMFWLTLILALALVFPNKRRRFR